MEDDRLVQLALSRGFVKPEHIERAKAEQKALADRGIDHGVYFLLQDLGFLAEGDARELRRSVSSSAIRALEVDGYVIQGRLGSGGMGDVFRAVHPDGRIAAVKLLSGKLAKSEEYVRRFLREGRAMQRLDHPHIVGVSGAGETLGTRYILMELVEGPSLKSWLIEKGKLDPARAAVVLRQMAEALGYAWTHGVLHRDVKPANILVGPARPGVDEPFCTKLCDFGLARLGPDAGDPDLSRGGLTGTGLALGTPHYMSPEQASGEHDLDQRADIYGLGATIYHALLGQTLYSGKSSAVIMYKQVTENVDLEQLRSGGVAPALVDLLGGMLEKRRTARIADWKVVLERINALAPAPPSASAQRPAAVVQAQPEAAGAPEATADGGPAVPAHESPRPARLMPLVVGTAIVVALVAAAAVGLVLTRGGVKPVDPAGFAGALAAVAGGGEAQRTIALLPGTYVGTIRLGAGHRGLRLRAAGPGVELVGSGGGPAIVCEPGLLDARIEGVVLRGAGAVALETIGACDVQLAEVRLDGGLVLGGGVVVARHSQVHGAVRAGDRGLLDISTSAVHGSLTIERADLRLTGSLVEGRLTARSATVALDGVRILAAESPGLVLEQATCTVHDLLLSAPGVGLEVRASTCTDLRGLTILGSGPSIAWDGDRQAGWHWERFSLATPPRGLPGALPGGPGADAARLPPPP